MSSIQQMMKEIQSMLAQHDEILKNSVHPLTPRITRSMVKEVCDKTAKLTRFKSNATKLGHEACDIYGTFRLSTSHVDFLTDSDASAHTSTYRAILLSDLKKQRYKPICFCGGNAIMFCSADIAPGVVRQSMTVQFASVEDCQSVFATVHAWLVA
jgi:hypothetical protein